MKKIAILLSLAAAAMFAATGCNSHSGKSEAGEAQQSESAAIAQGSIVYFNLDQVLDEYDMANDLRSEVEAKVATIQKEVERRQKNLENAVNDFTNKVNKGLMTSAVAADQQKKLQQQDAAFQQFAQQKQNEIMEEQQVMMNRLADAIKTFVEDYNAEKQYAMILSNQAGVPVVVADTTLNITRDIINGLNKEYVKTKNEK